MIPEVKFVGTVENIELEADVIPKGKAPKMNPSAFPALKSRTRSRSRSTRRDAADRSPAGTASPPARKPQRDEDSYYDRSSDVHPN